MLASLIVSCLVSAAPGRLIDLHPGSTYQWWYSSFSNVVASASGPGQHINEAVMTWVVVDSVGTQDSIHWNLVARNNSVSTTLYYPTSPDSSYGICSDAAVIGQARSDGGIRWTNGFSSYCGGILSPTLILKYPIESLAIAAYETDTFIDSAGGFSWIRNGQGRDSTVATFITGRGWYEGHCHTGYYSELKSGWNFKLVRHDFDTYHTSNLDSLLSLFRAPLPLSLARTGSSSGQQPLNLSWTSSLLQNGSAIFYDLSGHRHRAGEHLPPGIYRAVVVGKDGIRQTVPVTIPR